MFCFFFVAFIAPVQLILCQNCCTNQT